MSLNRYGIQIKQWLKSEYPIKYQELIMDGTIMEKLEERQEEVMQYRESLLKNYELNSKDKKYFEKVGDARMIQNQIEEALKEVMHRPF